MLKTFPKCQLKDLAIFGEALRFTDKVHVGGPNMGNRDRLLHRITGMLNLNWRTNNAGMEGLRVRYDLRWFGRVKRSKAVILS
jgi:hypothetical protein